MKKDSRRSQRVALLVREELSRLALTEAHDPELRLVTFTDVEMPPDLKSARVYFSCLGGDAERERAAKALGRATGYLRREVTQRCALRYAPELHFIFDSHARAGRADRAAARAGAPAETGRGREGDSLTRPAPAPLPAALRRGFLLLVDKPSGLTSHDVVERVRARLSLPRIGHSGTLDPIATGLLLLCAGAAARLQGFFTRMDKTYVGRIRLGRSTTTYDREGEPVGPDRDATGVQASDVARAAGRFRGEFLQAPPPYSAKKVGGRKLYELARKGKSVAVEPKKVRVTALELGPLEDGGLSFSISCSSGTYIRSIANELGEILGCGAHLETLRRTRIGDFRVEDALPLGGVSRRGAESETLSRPPHAVALLQVPFPFERIRVESLEAWKLRKGQAIPLRQVAAREGDWVTLVGTR